MNPIETLSDEALLLRLRSAEHDFVERKPLKQKGEWLQVAVAFANSAPVGWPAVLFVGVDDEGNPQQESNKLEDLSKSVAAILAQAYPPIYFDARPLHVGDKACLAVVIPGSENRPHFAGQSYIRTGPSTISASEAQFTELIASRNSKARTLLSSVGRVVTWKNRRINRDGFYDESLDTRDTTVLGCNAHYLTVRHGGPNNTPFSYPLIWLEVGFDHQEDRLQIFLYFDR